MCPLIVIGKNLHFLQKSAHCENCRFRADSYYVQNVYHKKKNEGNFYKFQSENAQFQILASKAKEILEVIVIFNLGIIR
jgi:hypothetical protein